MNSAIMVDLCEEMVIEILRRLPVKSLVRFTAVCRRWKSIITGPQFRLQSSQTKLLVQNGEECYALVDEDDENLVLSETVEFPFKHRLSRACVVGSGNGLVCVCVKRQGTPNKIIIWNPSIRRHAVIPPKDSDPDHEYIVSHGFGATISGNDYKYVKFVASRGGDVTVEIYSLKTGTWRTIYLDFDLYKHKYFSSKSAASLQGRLHWAAVERRKKINSISAFDLEDEVFDHRDIMLPECFSSDIDFLYCVNLFVTKDQSQLAMIVNEDEPNRAMHSVWVMREYGDVNSWTKLFRLDLAAMVGVDRALQEDSIRRVQNAVVHLLKNGELLLGLKVVAGEKRFHPIVKYNPKTSKGTDILGVSSSSRLCGFTNYYKESLVFLAAHDDPRVQADGEVLSGERPAVRRNEAWSGSGSYKRRVKRRKQY